MFSMFKSDPTKKLKKQYEAKLQEAMEAQRGGDIRSYSMLSEEADGLYKQFLAAEQEAKAK
ncbi:MAG: DUF6435 family protein [Reinekea forsetii]|jgi:hypothetical protein|uniref:Lacal_2735 family protein n=1 Tax=Reinekea forsetii TaxID=1336806 RepID=A0A2K8KSM5_9GAMM|nr:MULTISPECIES: DUF6435 family protein [Reinekea]ATX77079.1 hypothetical protein REIFOR_01942 [Reinekea forsetii]MDO7641393.1 DUF6435 family protein [Reinekea forsetii]MDO7674332.1 DUF6435 family protein [Reinekea forsetii]